MERDRLPASTPLGHLMAIGIDHKIPMDKECMTFSPTQSIAGKELGIFDLVSANL